LNPYLQSFTIRQLCTVTCASLFVTLLVFVLMSPLSSQPSQQNVSVRVLDEKGTPTPARVRFVGRDSIYYAPDGHTTDFPIQHGGDVLLDRQRRFAYVDGAFTIDLPVDSVRIEVVKGFAYLFVDKVVEVEADGETLDIQLDRWFDFPGRPWISGDVHVHHIDPSTALLEMKAEDLNVCNVLTSDFTDDQANFRGEADPLSEANHIVYVNQEYRDNRLGHVNLLNLKELIEPVKPMREFNYPLNIEASDRVHAQGGHVSWAHFAAWPGLEGPLGLVMRKVDAVELLCTMDPFHEPIFAADVVPEVRMNSGLRIWYRLLNSGLRVPATAGTDKMSNEVTVGGNRVYAAIDGDFTYASWIDALNQGKTFVSNSPFLFCEVEGEGPGESLSVKAGQTMKIKATVSSQLPVDRLEIVANGVLIAETSLAKGEMHKVLEAEFTPEGSVWIAARSYQFNLQDTRGGVSFAHRRSAGAGPTQFNSYFGTLRPETAFAHTSPTYVRIDDRPIRSREDAEYFVQYLRNSTLWLDTKGKFPSESAKQEALAAFERGIERFLELAEEDR
jgi:hypothetical protein